jgi:uncharacterized protein DUF927
MRRVCERTRSTSEKIMNRTNRKSTRLKLVAVAEDEANSEFIALIDFRDINGYIRRLALPKSSLRKIDHLREALDTAGAYLPTNDQKARGPIKALSISANNAAQWKYAPAVGWYNGHWFFVLPEKLTSGRRRQHLYIARSVQRFLGSFLIEMQPTTSAMATAFW